MAFSDQLVSLFDLSQQTALITGASSGLGKRFAKLLSEAGARTILAARREATLQEIAKTLPNARVVQMDVSNKTSVQEAFSLLEDNHEKINIVVCAAGIGGKTPVFDLEEDINKFDQIIQTNLLGVWYVTQRAAQHMKKHRLAGSIINMASINGTHLVREGGNAYAASKAAVIQLTRALATELARESIRINSIAAGLFYTPLTKHTMRTPELKKKRAESIPVKYIPGPEDLDSTILYLASNKASRYVTGSCLTVDGGASWYRNG